MAGTVEKWGRGGVVQSAHCERPTVAAAGGKVELIAWSTVDAWSTDVGPDCVPTDLIMATERSLISFLAFINVCIHNSEL